MSNPDTAARPPAAPDDVIPSFDRVRSGYDPAQVHRHIAGLMDRARSLEHRLASLGRGAVRDLVQVAESPQGKQMLADLIRQAADEITGQQAVAAQAAQQILADARSASDEQFQNASRRATEVLGNAGAEATKLVAGAREQADTVLSGARAEAKSILDRASAHAAAVHEGAERRLAALTGHHQATRRRLAEITSVTRQVLEADDKRGSLADEVTRTTAAVSGAVPPELTALEGGRGAEIPLGTLQVDDPPRAG